MAETRCLACNAWFVPRWSDQVYCNTDCRQAVSSQCPECGGLVTQNRIGAPRKYCSRKCAQRVGNRAANRRRKPLASPIQKFCAHCGKEFVARSRDRIYCPDGWCAQLAYQARRRAGEGRRVVERVVVCDGCGAEFVGRHPSARWCSKYCANKYWGLVRSRRRYAADGSALYVDREVFERDNWTCYLCNLPVDPELDRLHEFGATIDHIVPLSRGGLDELSNVALAHWSCNRTKRAS